MCPVGESSIEVEALTGLATAHPHSWLGAVPCWALDVSSGSSNTGVFYIKPSLEYLSASWVSVACSQSSGSRAVGTSSSQHLLLCL